jgi:hypothetical protein
MTVLQSIKVFRCWLTSIVKYIFGNFLALKSMVCCFLCLDDLRGCWGEVDDCIFLFVIKSARIKRSDQETKSSVVI